MVTIVIRPRHIERFFYILTIIVLLVLLVMSYMNNSGVDSNGSTNSKESIANKDVDLANSVNVSNETASTTGSEVKSEPGVVETCKDKVKNQDETNIDCGGVCTSENGAYYYSGSCHKTKEVKVATSLNIDKVTYSGGKDTSAELESMIVDISNGEGKSETFSLEIYVKDRYDTSYLNQLDGSYRGDPFTTEKVLMGKDQVINNKKILFSHVSSPYLFQNDYYSAGDPFMLEVILKNSDGEEVASKKSSVIHP